MQAASVRRIAADRTSRQPALGREIRDDPADAGEERTARGRTGPRRSRVTAANALSKSAGPRASSVEAVRPACAPLLSFLQREGVAGSPG